MQKCWSRGPHGERTLAVADLYVPPAENVRAETALGRGEIITHIEIPAQARGLHTSYRKIRARQSWDFALAGVALALAMEEDKIAKASVVLSGAAAVAGAQPLRANGYKIAMFQGMLKEELQKVKAKDEGGLVSCQVVSQDYAAILVSCEARLREHSSAM